MSCQTYIRLLFTISLVILSVSSLAQSRKIDCTRFVFAPRCRGVAAKRAEAGFMNPDNDDKNSAVLGNGWGNDLTGSNFLQRLQYLSGKSGRRQSDADSDAEEELWDRMMAARALRH